MTLEEMNAQRDTLLAARYRGVRTVEIEGRRVTYATDAEMAAAITDLERRIAPPAKRRTSPANSHVCFEGALNARVAEASPAPSWSVVRRLRAGLANRRLKGFQPSRAHLNTLIAAAGPDITARARWLVRNNGYAANAIESWAGNVVGAGIKPSSLIADPAIKPKCKNSGSAGPTRPTPKDSLTSRPAAARRARGVHCRRSVPSVSSAPPAGWAHGPAPAADAPFGDAATLPQRASRLAAASSGRGLSSMRRESSFSAVFFDFVSTRSPRRRARVECRRDFQAERLGGGQVDDEFELGRLLDGKVGGLRPLENLVD